MTRPNILTLWILLATSSLPVMAKDAPTQLRVCADPDSLPFSNDRLEGFENKIAQVVANDLHTSLQFEWSPQGKNFIRQTLNAGKCDLLIGAPSDWGAVLTTQPYYASTYVFVYPKDKETKLSSFDDPALRKLKIGLPLISGGGNNPPPAYALARRGLASNVVGYSVFPPSEIIEAVANGEVGAAVVWGPLGGYYAKRQSVKLAVTPVAPSEGDSSLRFNFDISMGVRRGDSELKDQLEGVLKRRHKEIAGILERYGVPTIPLTAGGSLSAKSIPFSAKGEKEEK